MCKRISLIGLAGVLTLALASTASADSSSLLGDAGWESFANARNLASFAWAGVDETFASHSLAELIHVSPQPLMFEDDGLAVDVALLTGVPAPEPPAIVLAGLAFGGVLCGRSVLARRRKAGEGIPADENKS